MNKDPGRPSCAVRDRTNCRDVFFFHEGNSLMRNRLGDRGRTSQGLGMYSNKRMFMIRAFVLVYAYVLGDFGFRLI